MPFQIAQQSFLKKKYSSNELLQSSFYNNRGIITYKNILKIFIFVTGNFFSKKQKYNLIKETDQQSKTSESINPICKLKIVVKLKLWYKWNFC